MRAIIKKLSKRERIVLYVSATVVLAVFFDRAVLSQVMNKMSQLNREIRTQEKKLQMALYIASQEDLITKEHNKYTQDVRQKSSDEEEKSQLHTEIVNLAKKAGVFLGDIKTSSIEESELYKKYIVQIEVESKIAFLADFIYQLEKSPRLLRVEKFHLAPKDTKTDILKAEITVTGILLTPKENLQ